MLDKESGLYYMNARYYDPKVGIFLTPDPSMSGLNHYAYCSANPINYSDPTGMYDCGMSAENAGKAAAFGVSVSGNGGGAQGLGPSTGGKGKNNDATQGKMGKDGEEAYDQISKEEKSIPHPTPPKNIIREMLALSLEAYGNVKGLTKDWKPVENEWFNERGLKSSMMNDQKTGFSATLFQNNVTGKYALAFRGTDDIKDVGQDIKQALGNKSEQYEYAITLSRTLARLVGNENLTLTGHSLGGGMVSIYSSV